MNPTLAQALRAISSSCIAFVGAGGKTTAMFQLAKQLSAPVIVTATSHLGTWQTERADQHIIVEDLASLLEKLNRDLKGTILVTGAIDGDRTQPVNDESLQWLYQFSRSHSIPLLIEADGSRQKPIKAWAEHEPPISFFVDHIVQVVGLDSLGKTLSDETVHRPDLFSKLSGVNIGETITPNSLIRVLTHKDGGQKNIPLDARKTLLINQTDTPELQATAQGMAPALLSSFHAIVVASLEQEKIFAVYEPTAGIILAAGESSRYGQAKQLLDWHGQPFVRVVAKTAMEAGLSPVVVITGSNAEQVEAAVEGLDVKIIRNSKWQSGQGSSIRQGVESVNAVSPVPGSAVFLLADQPQVTASIIRALTERHAQGLFPILAPMVIDQRANPVLFDRVTFQDLMSLEGDVGGRAIFHKHRVEYLPWHDDRLLLDVDTPEQYQRLIEDDTL